MSAPPDSSLPSMDFIALSYWSQEIRPTLGDLPIPGLRHLRDRYILEVADNPTAQEQLLEWWLASPFGKAPI